MTDVEKKELLLKICPELDKGINEGDVNKYIIELIHNKLALEKYINTLIDKMLELWEQNEIMQRKLLRIGPLLNAVEGEQK